MTPLAPGSAPLEDLEAQITALVESLIAARRQFAEKGLPVRESSTVAVSIELTSEKNFRTIGRILKALDDFVKAMIIDGVSRQTFMTVADKARLIYLNAGFEDTEAQLLNLAIQQLCVENGIPVGDIVFEKKSMVYPASPEVPDDWVCCCVTKGPVLDTATLRDLNSQESVTGVHVESGSGGIVFTHAAEISVDPSVARYNLYCFLEWLLGQTSPHSGHGMEICFPQDVPAWVSQDRESMDIILSTPTECPMENATIDDLVAPYIAAVSSFLRNADAAFKQQGMVLTVPIARMAILEFISQRPDVLDAIVSTFPHVGISLPAGMDIKSMAINGILTSCNEEVAWIAISEAIGSPFISRMGGAVVEKCHRGMDAETATDEVILFAQNLLRANQRGLDARMVNLDMVIGSLTSTHFRPMLKRDADISLIPGKVTRLLEKTVKTFLSRYSGQNCTGTVDLPHVFECLRGLLKRDFLARYSSVLQGEWSRIRHSLELSGVTFPASSAPCTPEAIIDLIIDRILATYRRAKPID